MDYFTARGIGPREYQTYRLPGWLRNALSDVRNLSFLDVGCGFGQTLLALRKLGGARLRGTDLSPRALEHCRGQGLDVQEADLSLCPDFDGGPFDVILCSHVLEHLDKSRMVPALENLRRHLAPGGRLFLSLPNAQAHTGAYWAFEDFTHKTLFTSGSLLYVARMAGFSQVRFLDIDCTEGSGPLHALVIRPVRKLLMPLYRANRWFWNRVTASSYHRSSPNIYSFEIKAELKV